jgi:hypothetical protein
MADPLVDTATADAYYAARGNASWAALDEAVRDGALLYAQDYLYAKYTCADWESWLDDSVPLPSTVEQAIIELAGWHALVAPLTTGITTPPGGQVVKREKLDVLEREYQDSTSSVSMAGQSFETWIDSLVSMDGECSMRTMAGYSKVIARA